MSQLTDEEKEKAVEVALQKLAPIYETYELPTDDKSIDGALIAAMQAGLQMAREILHEVDL